VIDACCLKQQNIIMGLKQLQPYPNVQWVWAWQSLKDTHDVAEAEAVALVVEHKYHHAAQSLQQSFLLY
jgi:hypothetical protein